MNLAKRIEYAVTNSLGYNPLQTDFTKGNPKTHFFKQPLEELDIVKSKHAVKAHLAHMYRNRLRLLGNSLSNSLRNLPEGASFPKTDGRHEVKSMEERKKLRKGFVYRVQKYTRGMNNEIFYAQNDAKRAVLISGRDLGKLIRPYLSYFSNQSLGSANPMMETENTEIVENFMDGRHKILELVEDDQIKKEIKDASKYPLKVSN